jgi:hypothetical protein
MYCQSTTLVKYGQDTREATALRCRSWLCPECAPVRAKQLICDVMRGAPTTFLTLTCRRVEGEHPNTAAKRLIDAWRRARRQWMRRQGIKKLPFFAVVEQTKLGWPHLHIMLRGVWIDQRWLSRTMEALANSPIVDIRRIENAGRAAVYVAKYAGKANHKFGTCKRYWSSQDYKLKRDEPDEHGKKRHACTERWPQSIDRIVKDWITIGWRVQWLTKWRARVVTSDA